MNKIILKRDLALFKLALIMAGIGIFTIFAGLNTYEVITHRDAPLSTVVKTTRVTDSSADDIRLSIAQDKPYEVGSFGIPKKIKFPEVKKHVDLTPAIYETNGWSASHENGQVIVTADSRQKVFGRAVIYIRVNTPMTRNLGSVYQGDIINIVTSEGWQLGYQVKTTASTFSEINVNNEAIDSEIILVLINEETGEHKYIDAFLTKVGDRV